MNIYKIERKEHGGYDTFSDAVVIASNEDEARYTHPSETYGDWDGEVTPYDEWIPAKDVIVTLIGVANEEQVKGVVTASFHDG